MPRPLFDAHFHVIDPTHSLVENNGFMPDAFTAQDYVARVDGLGVGGGAVVSGSFQGFDQGYLTEALAVLGPNFVGVTQLPADVSSKSISELDRAGVRAVHFNLKRGGSAGVDDLELLANRVFDVAGWHTELYVDARELPDLERVLTRLPRVSIDHLGMHEDGLKALLRLVEHGAMVKATGFGRVELDPASAMRAILRTNPGALMVGTDLPSTRARRPFADADLALAEEVALELGGEQLADDVFWNNAAGLYRLAAQ